MGICPAARKNQAVFHESKYSALATKVTLRRITSGRKNESQKEVWFGARITGPIRRHVLRPIDLDPPSDEEDRAQQGFQHPVGHVPNGSAPCRPGASHGLRGRT